MTDEIFESRAGESPAQLPSRRTVLRGAALAGLAVPVLAACSSNDSNDAGGSGGSSTPTTDAPSDGGGGGNVLASTGDVPDGGGLILDDAGVVITQPAAGTFKGFSNICTHNGCPVDNVTDGTINCICHGSKYSIEDGSVVGGPAPAPLPPKEVTVDGTDIVLA